MTIQEFTYRTKIEEKKVVMGKLPYDDIYFVDIYPDYSIPITSTKYKTKNEAIKRFNSIKNRVSNKTI